MAAFNKFDQFANDVANKVHDLLGTAGAGADVIKVMLTNVGPNQATNQVKADIAEIGTGNGYTSGGFSVSNAGTKSGGVITVVATSVVFAASGGSIGPFRYAVFYNDTQASPAKPLVGYVDYGLAVTLAATETFTVAFGASLLTIS